MRWDYLFLVVVVPIGFVIYARNLYSMWNEGKPLLSERPRQPRQGSPIAYIVRGLGLFVAGWAIMIGAAVYNSFYPY